MFVSEDYTKRRKTRVFALVGGKMNGMFWRGGYHFVESQVDQVR